MSDWNNVNVISEDLLRIQGRISADVSKTVRYNDRPPPVDIKEETEINFFGQCMGDGNFTAAPDFRVIRNMLNLVNDKKYPLKRERDEEPVIKSSLNPCASDFNPQVKNKIHKSRNVAMTSILEKFGNKDLNTLPTPPSTQHNTKSRIKDDNFKDRNSIANVEPTSSWINGMRMFKRKTALKYNSNGIDAIRDAVNESPTRQDVPYKPSELANEYYKKYVCRNIVEDIKKDLWTRVETQLKEIDEKRRLKEEEAAKLALKSSSSEDFMETEFLEMKEYELLSHRHYLLDKKESCLVCEMFTKHKYDVELIQSQRGVNDKPKFLVQSQKQT